MIVRPQTILFGNGLNRLTPSCPSWGDLLAGIDNKTRRCENFNNLPFTLQYEVLLPDDYYTARPVKPTGAPRQYTIPDTWEMEIKRRIRETLGKLNPNPFYERLARLGAQNYITTNYEYLLHDTFRRLGCKVEHERTEIRYSIRRRACVSRGGHFCNIWSIHGELDRPNSMMLGLDHYCESIGKVDAYIKGTYEGQNPRFDSIEKRLLKNELDDGLSWIDLFFHSDIHIIGHGLDYSETDLWWLLNRRMRLFKKLGGEKDFNGHSVIPNTIIYYGRLDPDKAHLLQKFGVQYVHVEIRDEDYMEQYGKCFDALENAIDNSCRDNSVSPT